MTVVLGWMPFAPFGDETSLLVGARLLALDPEFVDHAFTKGMRPFSVLPAARLELARVLPFTEAPASPAE